MKWKLTETIAMTNNSMLNQIFQLFDKTKHYHLKWLAATKNLRVSLNVRRII